MATIEQRLDAIEGLLQELVTTIRGVTRNRQPDRDRDDQADVISGEAFRRKLRWGKDRFYAAKRAGRFNHLISLNASSARVTVYVRAKVDAWLVESPDQARRFFGKARRRP